MMSARNAEYGRACAALTLKLSDLLAAVGAVTFVDNLQGPLEMTFDAKNGRLVSFQTEPRFTSPVVWPQAGK